MVKKAVDTAATQPEQRIVIEGVRPPKDPTPPPISMATAAAIVAATRPVQRGYVAGKAESGGNQSSSATSDPSSDKNTASKDCQNPTTSNPVILATGEKIKEELDIVAGGGQGMGLTRTYRSASSFGMFGVKWLSSYDYTKLVATGCARHVDFPNQCMPYNVSGAASTGTMTYDPSYGYIVVMNSMILNYSASGLIQSVKNNGGITLLSFTYGSNPRFPSRVTNMAGRYLDFTYNAAQVVSKVRDPAGNEWNYTYQTTDTLATVTSPGTNPDVRTYHYESGVSNRLLTGISINGVRYSTYSYYGDQRVQESGLTGGEDRDVFSYGTDTTTVTDAKGQPTTYSFVAAQGAKKLSGVSRAATSTCAASAASTAYDSRGWIDYTLDWNGAKDDY
jgi:hypothetical protein